MVGNLDLPELAAIHPHRIFYVGNLKGVGRVYQQTFIDTYARVGFAKLYDRKTPITAADLLNDRVIPFYEEHGIPLQRVLTDRGTEYCGTMTGMNTSSTWPWKTSITREPKRKARRRRMRLNSPFFRLACYLLPAHGRSRGEEQGVG